ncbi:MAG: hypothetical protein FWE20_05905 [Defluviitaleaceae bacterium]|nr:hypothetical protein [Defluviitaleaceae bacterium]
MNTYIRRFLGNFLPQPAKSSHEHTEKILSEIQLLYTQFDNFRQPANGIKNMQANQNAGFVQNNNALRALNKPTTTSEKYIEFFDFDIKIGEFALRSRVSSGDQIQEDYLYFKFSHDIVPSMDSIAIALSTLCGQVYQRIRMDILVSRETLNKIRNFTKSDVIFTGFTPPPRLFVC